MRGNRLAACAGTFSACAAGCCAKPGDGGRRPDSKIGEILSWADVGGRRGGREGLHALALGTRRGSEESG
jgi:hypothetical protein